MDPIKIFSILLIATLNSCHLPGQKDQAVDRSGDEAGHWSFSENLNDLSGKQHLTLVRGGVRLAPESEGFTSENFAVFDGKTGWLEIPEFSLSDSEELTLAAWINTEGEENEEAGDIISQYNSETRRGFHLSIKTNYSPTNTGNFNRLYFGIDDDQATGWEDYGRPGNALMAFALAEFEGSLYAGTCEPGTGEYGHVYRLSESGEWIDCGFLDSSNSVVSLVEFEGSLYAATGHYRTGGSALPASTNENDGGGIFRFKAPDQWEACGKLPVECVGPMAVYKGKLYASSLYQPAAFFRYEGGSQWRECEGPGYRINALAVFDGYLYGTSYDLGRVFRYDGEKWEDCGHFGDPEINTQGYCFAIYEGDLFVATWRSGRVYRFDGIDRWTDVGRLGEELEVMGMLVHNGRLMGGTLPLAEVYSYEGDTIWRQIGRLDHTPDVQYRRAWTMAEHDGRVFYSTLPSGHIYGFRAGYSVASSGPISSGWQHIAAVKEEGFLRLYVNGELVNQRALAEPGDFDLNLETSLKIGFGPHKYFKGGMRDVRIYKRALTTSEVKALASS